VRGLDRRRSRRFGQVTSKSPPSLKRSCVYVCVRVCVLFLKLVSCKDTYTIGFFKAQASRNPCAVRMSRIVAVSGLRVATAYTW